MGRGNSGIGGSKISAGGSRVLPPLPSNVIGGQLKIFHDTMNDPAARGSNDVRFTSGIQDEVAFGRTYTVNGSYEILTPAGIQRRTGEITAFNGRLFGVEQTQSGFNTTDLRTGLAIGQRDQSKYAVWNTILVFNDGKSRMAQRLQSAETTFKQIH